jgi:HD-GYP domain-containing protein (c-di-GMP phosphodiesterase class II)
MLQSLVSVLDALGEAALLTDAELKLVAMNPLAESLYQVHLNTMVGKNLVALIGTVVSNTREEGWAAILRGDVWRGVSWHERPNRSRFRAEVSVSAIFDQTNTFVGTLAIIKDVTEREAERLRQNILGRSLRALAEAKTVDQLYQRILEALTGDDAADCAIFRTREHDGYHLLAAHGVARHLLEPIRVADFAQEESAFLRGEAIEIVFAAPETHEKYHLIQSLGFRQSHLVGQRVAGELVGSLALVYRQTPWVDLRPILPEIASALGARLERERTQTQLERERAALSALARISGSLRLAQTSQEAFEIVTEFVIHATRGLSSFVLLTNQDRTVLQPVCGSGLEVQKALESKIGRDKGLSWQVLDTGQPRFERMAATHPQAYLVNAITQGSYIGVPIFLGSDSQRSVIGVLTADTYANANGFSSGDVEIMVAIAEALSAALSRLSALETAQNRAAAFAKLAQLSSDLEQLEDEKSIAQRALLTLLDLTGLDAVAYMTLEGEYLEIVSHLGDVDPEYLAIRRKIPINPNDIFGSVVRQRQTILLEDYAKSDFVGKSPLTQFGFHTVVVSPVVLQGQVRSFITAASINRIQAFANNTQELVEFIAGRLARAIERSEGVQEVLDTRAQSFRTLGLALEARDFETKGHTDRVLSLAMQLGQAVGLNPDLLQALEWGALLHDIGKIAVPDHVLLKPSKLSPDEWLQIRQHPRIGFEMLQGLSFLPPETLEIVLYHQERVDGSGYPECRKAAQIPYLARLFAVVDVFDALTSARPYKAAWGIPEAIAELERQAGKTLDATLVQSFLGILARAEVHNVA